MKGNIKMYENIKFTSVKEALPKYHSNQARVYIKTADNRITKGMFYMNGGKPVFASYGTEVENVTEWAYQ
jgi:hypothetical protein